MKRLIVDKNISIYSKSFLNSLGYNLIYTIELPNIANSTSSHPDMQFLKIGDKKALVAEYAFSYYKSSVPDFEIIPIFDIGEKYPYDCKLNAVLLNTLFITTEHQYRTISEYINVKPIFVNQGYTKCSTCILNDKSIITGDVGVLKKSLKNGVRAYLLPDGEIELNGYKNGFWGGATGLLDEKHMFFNGNVELLSCYSALKEILAKEKIEPLYHKHTPLTDNGSILSIDF